MDYGIFYGNILNFIQNLYIHLKIKAVTTGQKRSKITDSWIFT